MPDHLDPLREKASLVYERLLTLFGQPEWRDPMPAVDELVCTILSQNTNDKNRDEIGRAHV